MNSDVMYNSLLGRKIEIINMKERNESGSQKNLSINKFFLFDHSYGFVLLFITLLKSSVRFYSLKEKMCV